MLACDKYQYTQVKQLLAPINKKVSSVPVNRLRDNPKAAAYDAVDLLNQCWTQKIIYISLKSEVELLIIIAKYKP